MSSIDGPLSDPALDLAISMRASSRILEIAKILKQNYDESLWREAWVLLDQVAAADEAVTFKDSETYRVGTILLKLTKPGWLSPPVLMLRKTSTKIISLSQTLPPLSPR